MVAITQTQVTCGEDSELTLSAANNFAQKSPTKPVGSPKASTVAVAQTPRETGTRTPTFTNNWARGHRD